ncbi:MAG: GNAT family N-acetyltransferase [Streptosporangiaceae bacterium]
MAELERLRPGHAAALLAFELENRAYFAATIPDRGDDFFEHFADRHASLLAEQDAGLGLFHVLVGDDGEVLGRFNLTVIENGTADLGYRVAGKAAGHGAATAAVLEVCRRAAQEYGLHSLHAATASDNLASQKVLARNGFVPVGETRLSGQPGITYLCELTGDHD